MRPFGSGLRSVRKSRCDGVTTGPRPEDLQVVPCVESLPDKRRLGSVSRKSVAAVQDGGQIIPGGEVTICVVLGWRGDLQVVPCVESLPDKRRSGGVSRKVVAAVQDGGQIIPGGEFLGGLPIRGSFYDEMIPSSGDLTRVDGGGTPFLPQSCKYLFYAYYKNAKRVDNSFELNVRNRVNFWFCGAVRYPECPEKDYTKRTAPPKKNFNSSGVIGTKLPRDANWQKPFEILNIEDDPLEEVYLAALIPCWLCKFILLHDPMNLIHLSTFKVASMIAFGEIFSLAIPILANIYRGLRAISTATTLKRCEVPLPFHYVYACIQVLVESGMLGFNDVICDDEPCALHLDSMSSILGLASYDLPLVTSKDLDGNPPLKEFSISHYKGKQQDAHQTKKASCHAISKMSVFCGNNFMTDCRRKVSVMAWKGLRAKIGRTSISQVPSLAEQAHIVFDGRTRKTDFKEDESSLERMKSDVLEKQSMVSEIREEISKVGTMPTRSAEDEHSLSMLRKLLFAKCKELEQLEWNP
ncbi:hypothetical protein JCGZ_05318 [Jatropha curcas]|uniref:Aminotransferase-like plant mobile domain-containing protein n=1 Tax=Jatropha curcas TaxID=180498 RepID=A0A067KQW5_JATCU|nr:hypothetical protein JCGZ_05318 [Jatropha curcas]